jgi:hypothetical protein
MSAYDARWCRHVLSQVLSMPLAAPFRTSRDPSTPDLMMIRDRLDRGRYEHVPHFLRDIKRMEKAAVRAHGEGSLAARMAGDLWDFCWRKFTEKSSCAAQEWLKEMVRTVAEVNEVTKWSSTMITKIHFEKETPKLKDHIGDGGDEVDEPNESASDG